MLYKTACIFLFCFTLIRTQEPDPWAKYQTRTLKEIIRKYAKKVVDNPDVVMNFKDGTSVILARDSFPSRVKVSYTEMSRDIPSLRKELIRDWLITTQGSSEHLKLFQKEYLFTEGSMKYWMPVQESLIEHFGKELKKGDEVVLFIVWAGAWKKSETVDWLFLVNEFEKE